MTAGNSPERRRALSSALVLILLLVVVAVTVEIVGAAKSPRAESSAPSVVPVTGSTPLTPSKPPATTPPPSPTSAVLGRELPRGGTTLFPRYRLVGYSGGPGTAAFGRLGIGNIDDRIREIERAGRSYTAGKRQIMPVLELITVVVHGKPGPDRKYRGRIDNAVINQYLAAARRHQALLLLNIQPGRADFLPEVQALAPWLKQPDVGIALDPEWAVGPGQVPGRVFGHTTAAELNHVGAWLGAFTRENGLPEKAMVVHQLASRIISNVGEVKAHKGVQVVLSVDGIGVRKAKEATWKRLVTPMPASMHPGFKLFFEEDREQGPLMTAAQVLQLKPRPDYVLYE